MKNEKFCFSKGTGLIALVGVLLVGFVLLTQMANQSTSTSTRADGARVIPVANRLITCPVAPAVKDFYKSGNNYYTNAGVCASCANFERSKSVVSCQTCCNEPATQAEYDTAHPAPTAFDCMTADAATGRKAGTYTLSGNGKVCTGVGTKLVNGGSVNQRCDNELNVALAKCTAPTAMACTGTYTLSGNGKVCTGVGTKLFKGGAPDQYCGNEASAPMAKCTAPTAIDCMVTDAATGRKAGVYTLNGNNTVCTGVGTKLFKGGAPDQYCGNEASAPMANCNAPGAMACPPAGTKVYSDGGNACYLVNGRLVNGGTGNQYCANKVMPDWTCCGNSTATGCQ